MADEEMAEEEERQEELPIEAQSSTELEEDADEPEEPQLNSIARAIQRNKGNLKETTSKEAKISTRAQSQPKASLPPVPAKPVDSGQAWYLATGDGQLRVRLLSDLSLSDKGELLLVPDPNEAMSAIISLGEDGSLLAPQSAGVFVNSAEVSKDYVLEHTDKITVGDGSVKIEFAKSEQTATAG